MTPCQKFRKSGADNIAARYNRQPGNVSRAGWGAGVPGDSGIALVLLGAALFPVGPWALPGDLTEAAGNIGFGSFVFGRGEDLAGLAVLN